MKEFLQGNVAAAKSAVENGLQFFSFYPITPSSEVGHYLARVMSPSRFVNAYSEVEVINLLYGASSAGARAMTATSGCGLSLMREGLSYMVGAGLPTLVYDVMRFGPGLGGITPSNQDISIAWGAGHGESKCPVLTPSTVQELADFVMFGFDIADLLRMPVIIMVDAILGQMYELCEIHKSGLSLKKNWAVGRGKRNIITSRRITSYYLEDFGQEKQISDIMKRNVSMYEICHKVMGATCKIKIDNAGRYITAIGTTARVLEEVAEKLGIGYFIPLLLSPMKMDFDIKDLIVVEIGGTQLYDIIRYFTGLNNIKSIVFPYSIPDCKEILYKILEVNKNVNKTDFGFRLSIMEKW